MIERNQLYEKTKEIFQADGNQKNSKYKGAVLGNSPVLNIVSEGREYCQGEELGKDQTLQILQAIISQLLVLSLSKVFKQDYFKLKSKVQQQEIIGEFQSFLGLEKASLAIMWKINYRRGKESQGNQMLDCDSIPGNR